MIFIRQHIIIIDVLFIGNRFFFRGESFCSMQIQNYHKIVFFFNDVRLKIRYSFKSLLIFTIIRIHIFQKNMLIVSIYGEIYSFGATLFTTIFIGPFNAFFSLNRLRYKLSAGIMSSLRLDCAQN